ncbi:MAG TPA: class I SAM-dependent methyltransferase [Micromonosporaceae bacterium]|nr:class I SAM-dependent methyltransferase [Micromonosporaceae bacterium]
MDFTDAEVAALYDLLNPWDGSRWPSDAFYTELVMAADSVLDVGCGTGSMLKHARELGHSGYLAGIDPDVAALERARRRADIEWVEGVAADISWKQEFELATMTSHAFQCLIEDDEVRASLSAIRGALRDGGRFAFETRHPQARAWVKWHGSAPTEVVDETGRVLRQSHSVESVIDGVVTLTETTTDANGMILHAQRGKLRFLDVERLNAFLDESGFTIEAQYGDWRRGPITDESHQIITIARS